MVVLFVSPFPGPQGDQQGYVPTSFLREDLAFMPLRIAVEVMSDGFQAEPPMSQGGTSDVYKVNLNHGPVAAKVLHDQESKALGRRLGCRANGWLTCQ